MKPSNIRIVTDSSSDLLELPGIGFASAPLKIITAQREYIDNRELDVAAMVQELAAYHGRSSTSCPGPGDWLDAFGDSEEIFCVTITSSLSGSCSAACVAREQYLREHPNRRVQIIDSLSVGPEMQLLIEKIRDCVLAGCDFAQTCAAAAAYRQKTRLLFLLESMKNLANNGRIKHIAAKAAGLLGIRAIGRASDHGTLEMLDKARGEKRALRAMAEQMFRLGYRTGAVRIGHCGSPDAAKALKELIQHRAPQARITLYPCRGLCSFYAEQGGLLVGFEAV